MGEVEFTPVDTGNMSEIPPDAPAGGWEGLLSVKKSKTSKDGFPMLILEWRLTEANEDENESYVGGKVTDFLTFFPKTHPATRMQRQKMLELCTLLGVDVPEVTSIKSWADIQDFIDSLEGAKAPIFTKVAPRKDTGAMATSVYYTKPGGGKTVPPPPDSSEEEVSAKPAKKVAKKVKAKG